MSVDVYLVLFGAKTSELIVIKLGVLAGVHLHLKWLITLLVTIIKYFEFTFEVYENKVIFDFDLILNIIVLAILYINII